MTDRLHFCTTGRVMDFRNPEFRQMLRALTEAVQQLAAANAPPGDDSAPYDCDIGLAPSSDHQRLLKILRQLQHYEELLKDAAASTPQSSISSDNAVNADRATEQPPASEQQEVSGRHDIPTSSVPRTLGDFRIVRLIASGGMGTVYEAEQVSLHRRVALKVLPFAALIDPRRLQRFKNEAQAAASLRHRNIVRIHSVGCDRGVHYFAMDYIEGRTLAELIRDLRISAFWPDDQVPHPETVSTKLLCPDKAEGDAYGQLAHDRRAPRLTDVDETAVPPDDG